MGFREQLEFLLSVSGVSRAVDDVRKFTDDTVAGADEAADKWEQMGSRMQRVGVGLTVGVTLPLIALGNAAGQAAAAEQASLGALEQALRQTLNATDEQVEATHRWVDSLEGAVAVSDQELRPALAQFIDQGADLAEAQNAVAAATDLAAARQVDLKQAVDAMAGAARGEKDALENLGISAETADGSLLSLNEITERIAESMGGRAAAAAETTAGKLELASIRAQDAKEKLGEELLPLIASGAELFAGLAEKIGQLPAPLQEGIVYVGLAAAAIGPLTAAMGTLMRTGQQTAAFLRGPWGGAVAGAAAAVGVAIVAYKLWNDAKVEARQRSQELTAALEQEGGAAQFVADQLAGQGLGAAWQALGIEAERLLPLLQAGTDEFQDGAEKLQTYGDAMKLATEGSVSPFVAEILAMGTRLGLSTGQLLEMLRTLDESADAFDDVAEATTEADAATEALTVTTEAAGAAAERSGSQVGHLADEARHVAEEAERAERALDTYNDAVDRAFDSALSAEEGAIRQRQAIADLREEMQGAAEDGEVTAAENDAITLSLLGLIDATGAQTDALVDAGAVQDTATARQAAQLSLLNDLKLAFPELAGQIDGYAAKLQAIPTEVRTSVVVDVDDRAFRDFVREWNIDGGWGGQNTFVLTPGVSRVR